MNRWIRDNQAWMNRKESVDHIVRYESIIEAPEAALEPICRLMGLSFDPAMLDFHADSREWFNADTRSDASCADGDDHRRYRN